MGFEEEDGEFFVAGAEGIEGDEDGFCVSGFSGADLFIGGIVEVAAGVADGGFEDAGGALEIIFGAPEAAGGEEGGLGFDFVGGGEIHRDGIDAVTGIFRCISFA